MPIKQSEQREGMNEDEFDVLVSAIRVELTRLVTGKNLHAVWYALIGTAYAACQDQEDLEDLRDIIDEEDDLICDEEVTLQ